jgi:hypothetical protein
MSSPDSAPRTDAAGELFSGETLGRLIPRKEAARELRIHARTAQRRELEDDDFPKSVFVHGRAFFVAADLEAYKRRLISRGFQRGSFPANPPRKAEG